MLDGTAGYALGAALRAFRRAVVIETAGNEVVDARIGAGERIDAFVEAADGTEIGQGTVVVDSPDAHGSGARLDGAVLFRRSGWFWRLTRSALPFSWAAPDQAGVPLSDEQRAQVYWNDHPAPPVSGGPLRR